MWYLTEGNQLIVENGLGLSGSYFNICGKQEGSTYLSKLFPEGNLWSATIHMEQDNNISQKIITDSIY